MLCDLNCTNLKCIATGSCVDSVPEMTSPSVVSGLYCGVTCDCAARNADPTQCAGMPSGAQKVRIA